MKIYLTEREMTVLKHLVNGLKNEEISEKLNIISDMVSDKIFELEEYIVKFPI